MTILPTRAKDGGINWDKLWPPETVRPEALRLSFIQVGKEAAAHARERCAKLAHECWENGIPAQEIAQRIRRMED